MLFSFLIPIILLTSLWGLLLTLAHIPGVTLLGEVGTLYLLQFLAIFGTGHPWSGIMVISGVATIAGALFDTYAFWSYQ
jgi:hypothetical protein